MVNHNRKVAVVFPGQGAQYVGMGKDLYERCPESREVFEGANRILGSDLLRLMFEGPEETLTRTANSQPAIFVMSYAAWVALKARAERSPARAGWSQPEAFAGLSLGEYTALVAAGAFSFEDGLRIVCKRGRYMEEACEARPGTMASVIGLTMSQVRDVCDAARAHGIVDVANANSPGQIVVSGEREAVQEACRLAKEHGAKAVIPLNVSGAFHSGLMKEAERRLAAELTQMDVSVPRVPVIANVTGREESEPREIIANLARQVTGSVLFQQSIELLLGRGVNTFVEVGCGKVLQGLVKRINPQTVRMGVEDMPSLEATLHALEEGKSEQ
ncbi:MAG: ACP S-malonyltransferase [bacterium]|nr:ACP S-malonyltransferase [bacterium]